MPSRGPHADLEDLGASPVKVGDNVGTSRLGPPAAWRGAPCRQRGLCRGLWEGPGLLLEGPGSDPTPKAQGMPSQVPSKFRTTKRKQTEQESCRPGRRWRRLQGKLSKEEKQSVAL